jgi:hypothetical protein
MFRLEIALILIYSQFMPVAEYAINPPKLSQKPLITTVMIM